MDKTSEQGNDEQGNHDPETEQDTASGGPADPPTDD